MNLQQLRYLVATADEGTMTRAAAALHVAQPALSRGIRGLEVELGITAFERRGRGVTLTPEGAEAVAIARRVLAEVDRLTAIGRLRVCSVRGQATEIASPVIARLVTGGHGRARLDAVDTPAEVFEALSEQVREKIVSCFRWERFSSLFQPSDDLSEELLAYRCPPLETLLWTFRKAAPLLE
ncbi:MAG: LysR family transcriptional regulator, partial [Acidimicrobiia bacterium]